ncbi:unnamed protein product, partial [Polarella glacialis]
IAAHCSGSLTCGYLAPGAWIHHRGPLQQRQQQQQQQGFLGSTGSASSRGSLPLFAQLPGQTGSTTCGRRIRIRRQAASGETNTNRDRDLLVVLLSQFPLFVGVGALFPILPLYGQQFGLTASSVGLILSAPSIAKLALNFPMGQLADSAGRRILMVGGMLVLALGDLGTGLATALPALLAARLVTGAGLSVSDAGFSAWVADVTQETPGQRASFLGLQSAMISSAFVIGPTLGGMAVDQFGMSSIFFAVGAGAVVCAAGYSTLPETRSTVEIEEVSRQSFLELLESDGQQALAGVSAAFYTGAACKLSVIPAVAAKAFGAAPTEVGQLFSALAAVAILGTLAGGRLADAVGPRTVIVASGAICTLAYAGAAFAVHEQARDAFYGCLSLWALAAAVKSPALQAFAMEVAPE